MAEIKKVGVLGCGLMGHGIAQVAAQGGYDVVVREVDQATLDKGLGKIEKQLARAVEKGKAEQADADAVRGRIQGTTDYADLADCDLVIEAMTGSEDVLVAKYAPSLTIPSTSRHISSFLSRSSVIASITRSQSARSA